MIKKQLKKPPPKEVKPPTDYHPVIENIVPAKGVKNPFRPELVFMNPEATSVRLHKTLTVPNTYVGIDKTSKRIRSLLTVMPNGLLIAWDVCGTCSAYFTLCRCKGGVGVCRSVEYIYDSTVAKMAGEEWDHTHPAYYGSIREAARKARQGHSGGLERPTLPQVTPRAGKSLTGPSVKPQRAIKTLKKSGAAAKVIETGDTTEMDASAKSSVRRLSKSFDDLLKATPQKKILKKTKEKS